MFKHLKILFSKQNFSRKEYIFRVLRSFFDKEYAYSREYLLFKHKEIAPLINSDINLKGPQHSQTKIDIVCTILPKDLDTFSIGISQWKKHIKHEIGDIYLISPNNNELINYCENNGLIFIDEKSIFGFDKSEINYFSNGIDRSGWLFQQLLKWGVSTFTNCDNYLILDADTFFIQDKIFTYANKYILDFSDEYHLPYFDTFEKLTGMKPKHKVSFVSHYMIINKFFLSKLKAHIESRFNIPWYEAIIKLIDKNQPSYFSEFETYANFVLARYPKDIMIEYWFNKSLKKDLISFNDALANYGNKGFKSLSFHTYNRNSSNS